MGSIRRLRWHRAWARAGGTGTKEHTLAGYSIFFFVQDLKGSESSTAEIPFPSLFGKQVALHTSPLLKITCSLVVSEMRKRILPI